MRSAVAFVVLALIGGAAGAQQAAAPTPTVTLYGVVTTANDAPLPRVRVSPTVAVSPQLTRLGVRPEASRGVLTDDRGRFTIRVPSTATLRLAFVKARYTTYTADLSPRALAAQGSEIRVRMSLAGRRQWSGARSIRRPLDVGDRVAATGRRCRRGRAEVHGLPPGDYWIAATESVSSVARGLLAPDPDLLESRSARATRITLAEGQALDLALRPIGR